MKIFRSTISILLVAAGVFALSTVTTSAAQGGLEAGLFDEQIIVWKSITDLNRAVDIIARGDVRDGDFDALLRCWASAGTPVTILGSVADGELLHVSIPGDHCEGYIFKEEYSEVMSIE